MITFEEFKKNVDDTKESVLSWESSNAENNPRPARKKNSKSESVLSWKSSNAENNSRKIKESTEEEPALSHTGKTLKNQHDTDYDSIHDHPDIAPKGLTDEHKEAIGHYVMTGSDDKDHGARSSANMNMRLRQGLATKVSKKNFKIQGGHSADEVDKGIKALSSAFTPENTNKKTIVTHCGVPPAIGNKIKGSKPGSKHTLAGFTSTSTDPEVARFFSSQHALKDGKAVDHRIQFHVHPGAGLSLARHSNMSLPKESGVGDRGENEVLLHHGAHAVYSHTEKVSEKRPHPEGKGWDHDVYIHHMDVYPDHKPLSEYGKYEE